MTRPVNGNTAPHMKNRCSSSLGVMVSSTPPLRPPRGLSPAEPIFSFSQGGGGTELCRLRFGFTTLRFKPLRSQSCYAPKLQQQPQERNHVTRRKHGLDLVSCTAVGCTRNSADAFFFFLNYRFHSKLLRLAPTSADGTQWVI